MAQTMIINGRKFTTPRWNDDKAVLDAALADIKANREIRNEAAATIRNAMVANIDLNWQFSIPIYRQSVGWDGTLTKGETKMKKSMHWGVSFTNAKDRSSQFCMFSYSTKSEAEKVAKKMGGRAVRYLKVRQYSLPIYL